MNRSTGTRAAPEAKLGAAPASAGTPVLAGPRDARVHDGSRTSPWWRVARVLRGPVGQAAVSAVLLGLLLHGRYGYSIGDRDHAVLSSLGMQWAHPDWFVGDWTVANAPQPHWLFDLITYAGSATNTLPLLYLSYWLAGLVVFGAATTLVARTWVPRDAWLAILAVTVFAGVSPTSVLGASAMLFATPLPNILGGALLYLCVGGLLTGRYRLAAWVSVATALIHVQLGTMSAVLLLIMAVVRWRQARRPDWALLIGGLVSTGVVLAALRARPVAGKLSDFSDVCRQLIPYHCEATTWEASYLFDGAGMVGLALLTYFFLPVGTRWRAVIVLGLPAVGTLGGVAADRLDIPLLGELAQGLNIYRLMLVLLPFAFWGVLVPVFAELSAVRRWVILGAVLVLGTFALQSGWAIGGPETLKGSLLLLAFGGLLVLPCVVRTVPGIVRDTGRVVRVAAGGLTVIVLASTVGAHIVTPQPFVVGMYPHGELAAWGEDVQRVAPPGSQLLAPPLDWGIRMITKRAVVADCKYAPYGGPTWREYKSRIEAMGGFGQCLGTLGAFTYNEIAASRLVETANRYHAGYIVVESGMTPESRNQRESRVPPPETTGRDATGPDEVPTYSAQADGLARLGWRVLVRPNQEAPFYLLKAPGG